MNRKILFFFCLIVSPFLYGEQSPICLALNIKNDESELTICLQNIERYVDCLSICDFGSSEKKQIRIDQFLKNTKIPYLIHRYESNEYSQHPKLAAESAKKTLKKCGFALTDSYVLFLEKNQLISSDSKIDQLKLSDDSYLILEKSNDLDYYTYKHNLIRASLPLDTIVHLRERSFSTAVSASTKLRTLKLEEIVDEQETEVIQLERSRKNIELFSQALVRDPNNQKYLLYLAQALKKSHRYEEAISTYKSRIQNGGNAEEVWFCLFMMAECYEQMGNWPEALSGFLSAYQYAPHRAEAIKKISVHYRSEGYNDIAYIFAKHGLRIPHYENSTLLPIPVLYDYDFDEELSIISYYTPFKDDGYVALSDLLIKRSSPDWVKDQGYRNILFYTEHLPSTSKTIQADLPMVEGTEKRTYNPMNPSIVKIEDGYHLICRAVNYTQTGAKHFHTPDPTGMFRTKNYLIHYDKNFNVLSQNEIIEDLKREKFNAFWVEGLEDCRILDLNGNTWFTCTTFDTNPSGAIQISLAKLVNDRVPNHQAIKLEKLVPLQGPDPHRCEKNWLPFVKDGQIYAIYNASPFTIFQPNVDTGECFTVLEHESEHDFSRFRGSAAPIEFDRGYLMLVHEVVMLPDHTRVYLHRFVYLNDQFKIELVSKPFTFNHQGVEFCLSMTIDHTGQNLIMPIGIEDRQALLLTVDLKDVRAMLAPLPKIFSPF